MKYVIDFLDNKKIENTLIFTHLKSSEEEVKILRYLTKEYVKGNQDVIVFDALIEVFSEDEYVFLKKLSLIKNLLELGWIVQNSFQLKINDIANLELLNSSISLSTAFLKLIEQGSLEFVLPDIKPYTDHLEYLQDEFFRIDLYQKISVLKHSHNVNSPNIARLKNKLKMLEDRIIEKLKVSDKDSSAQKFFSDYKLSEKEQIIFLALLKEEYSGSDDNLRDMNVLIDLISFDDYEKIKNRSLLEDSSKLVNESIIDYDEILSPFGGITRNFFINDEILQKIMHPNKKKRKPRVKLENLVKEQDIFEFIDPKKDLDEVILHKKTKETLDNLLKQMDKNVSNLLKEWGIKDKLKSLDARIIFYGHAGTGKTLTAHCLAKSLKKQILSLDCSKILSVYVGESEKNVRKIFDTYSDLVAKSKSEPILLLNEADQFLSSRTNLTVGSAEKMHNQMQNIFLEQIESFEGVLIATTNLLESLDSAFSRRFNYKIEFKKPNEQERFKIWEKLLPKNAPYSSEFDIKDLSKYNLTGGQINLIIKNTAYKVATKSKPIFFVEDFVKEVQREQKGSFGDEKSLGFLS